MHPKAIEHAEARMDDIDEACAVIDHADSTSKQLRKAWGALLAASHTMYAKLEQGAKVNGKSTAWFGRMKKERKTDELLKYIHHARNSDEHGLEEVVQDIGVRYEFHGQDTKLFDIKIDKFGNLNGKAIVTGGPDPHVRRYFVLKLVEVVDTLHHDRFPPPTTHLGQSLGPLATAGDTAPLIQKYMRGLLQNAKALVVPSP